MIEKQKERYDEEVAEEQERQRLSKKAKEKERDSKKRREESQRQKKDEKEIERINKMLLLLQGTSMKILEDAIDVSDPELQRREDETPTAFAHRYLSAVQGIRNNKIDEL